MDISKVMGIALLGVFFALVLKQYKPEFAIYLSIIVSSIIILYCIKKLSIVMELLQTLSNRINFNTAFLSILLKVTGIAYITEFTANICKDAGETAIASKVEFAGKVCILGLSIPIFATLMETMAQLLA